MLDLQEFYFFLNFTFLFTVWLKPVNFIYLTHFPEKLTHELI